MSYPGENSDLAIRRRYREAGLSRQDIERDALEIYGVEVSEGYPTAAGLISAAQVHERFSEADWLVNGFPVIITAIGMCQGCWVEEIRDETGGLVKKVEFATGGWSGCERLIEAVLQNPRIRDRYLASSDGVGYVFLVPTGELKGKLQLESPG